ncbi:MAG: RNA-guided endonuclease InsQ/TnpB family protein, partial [Roseiflexaceae bacterium]
MKLIAQVKLNPTPEQHAALLATLKEANAACDLISAAAWQAREFCRLPLQKLVYHDIKASFHLGAQIVVRCIAKVTDAYKLDRKVQRTFQSHGAVAFDDRNLTWYTDKSAVSIWTLQGRQYIPYSAGAHQHTLLASRKGEGDLVYQRGAFYLLAVCDVPEPDEQTVDGALGIDLGINNLATDSDGERYSGRRVERKRRWYAGLRSRLQQRGSLSAKRHLRKLAGKQRRFQKDTNHRIAKQLVQKAKDTKRAIALEDLTHIRTRTTVRKSGRARHSNWAFGQLRVFISYKARLSGVPLALVDPAYTSQRCSACGHTERRDRKSQAEFCCVVCGHQADADCNAAVNISWAAVRQPIVSEAASAVALETSPP